MNTINTNHLTREQSIEIVGTEAVLAVESENCEPTCRVGFNGACQGDACTEWASCVSARDKNGCAVKLRAIYYTTTEQDKEISDHDCDGSYITWVIDHYSIT